MTEGAKYLILAASFAVLAISFGIGYWARKKVTSPAAFFGGAKIFGPLTIGLATMAAVGSAFAVVGVPGLVYSTGNTILLFMFAAPAFVFGYLVIGKKVRAMAEIGTVASLGDLSDLRFNRHRGIKLMLSVMLFLGCVMYLSAQVEACAKLFGSLFDWNTLVTSTIIFAILIAYTVLSGEMGGILTQAFQGFVMVIAGIILVFSFFIVTGGFGPVLEAISGPEGVAAGLNPNAMSAWGILPGSFSFAWVLIPAIGIMCQPQVLTRMFALKSPRDMPKLSIYAALSNMVAGLMVMAVGYCAIYLVAKGTVQIPHPDQAVFKVADHLGIMAQLFVYPAVLAAALSTSSLFLSLAGNIVSRDLPDAFGRKIDPATQMTASRIAMSLMGILAIAFAVVSGDMVAILGTYGFGTLTAATFPIFIIGLLWKRASSQGVMLGMLAALLSTLGCVTIELFKRLDVTLFDYSFAGFSWPGGVPWYINVLAASVVVTVSASLFTRGATGADLDRRVEMAMDL
jgi:Na+/proline symporter